MSDKNDNAFASVHLIRRRNARPEVHAIRLQSRVFTDQERGRRVKVGFLDSDKIHRMKRDKV